MPSLGKQFRGTASPSNSVDDFAMEDLCCDELHDYLVNRKELPPGENSRFVRQVECLGAAEAMHLLLWVVIHHSRVASELKRRVDKRRQA